MDNSFNIINDCNILFDRIDRHNLNKQEGGISIKKMKNKTIKPQVSVDMIVGFIIAIVLIIGVAVGITKVLVVDNQVVQSDFMEQLTKTTAKGATQTFDLTHRPVLGTMTVTNATSSTTLDFTVDRTNSQLIVYNGSGTINATYDWTPEGYADSGITRTVISFALIFVAIVGLIVAASLLKK